MSGLFITLEGPEGSGKTTNIAYLSQTLAFFGKVQVIREPGGTVLGEEIRTLLLKKAAVKEDNPTTMAELLLFFAARTQLLERVIKPALEANTIVLCDRFIDSTYAYQGSGRGLRHEVQDLARLVLRTMMPTHTLFFDISQETSEQRQKLRGKGQDRMEAAGREFHQRVYEGYQDAYRRNPDRMHRIDANLSLTQVQRQLDNWIQTHVAPFYSL